MSLAVFGQWFGIIAGVILGLSIVACCIMMDISSSNEWGETDEGESMMNDYQILAQSDSKHKIDLNR